MIPDPLPPVGQPWSTDWVEKPMGPPGNPYKLTFQNAVILPDGTVLVVGGVDGDYYNVLDSHLSCDPFEIDPCNFSPNLTPLLYSPQGDAWSVMAPHQAVRLYHSTAILLPDARVLVAGGQDIDPEFCSHPYFDAEIFSPPYLFKGQRPQIALAPSVLNYGQPAQIHVLVREGQSVEDLVLVRPGAVTHHFNTGKRSRVGSAVFS